jgi:hypothetical protein
LAGSVDSAYPLTNLYDLRPWLVAKATGTSITYRATFGIAQALDAIAFINTNATAIQVTNGAGLSLAVTIPSTPEDTLHLDPWIDLREAASASSTTWDIALTGPTAVALGLPVLVESLRDIQIQWEPQPVDLESHGTIVHSTDYGVKLKFGLGVRGRGLRGKVRGENVRADMLTLERDARGQLYSFLLIRDDDSNDAMWVDLTTDQRELMYVAPTSTEGEYVHDMPVEFTEQQKGWL